MNISDCKAVYFKAGNFLIRDNFLEFLKFLADLSCGLDENLSILEYYKILNHTEFNTVPLIYFENALESGEAVYLCKSLKCAVKQEIGDRNIYVDTAVCPLNVADNKGNCIACKCPVNLHCGTKYLKKLAVETVMHSYINEYESIFPNITFAINSCYDELQKILDVLATVTIYMMPNIKLNEDPFIVYLNNEKQSDYKDLKRLYSKNKSLKQKFTETINLDVILKCFKQIKELDWTGATIKNIFGDNFNIETEVIVTKQDCNQNHCLNEQSLFTLQNSKMQELIEEVRTLKQQQERFFSCADIKMKPDQSSCEVSSSSSSNGSQIEPALVGYIGEISPVPKNSGELLSEIPPVPKNSGELVSEIPPVPKNSGELVSEIPPVPNNSGDLLSQIPPAPKYIGDLLSEIPPVPKNIGDLLSEIPPLPNHNSDLLSEIRRGVKLKPAKAGKLTARALTECDSTIPNTLDNLFSEIRKGIQLKPVNKSGCGQTAVALNERVGAICNEQRDNLLSEIRKGVQLKPVVNKSDLKPPLVECEVLDGSKKLFFRKFQLKPVSEREKDVNMLVNELTKVLAERKKTIDKV